MVDGYCEGREVGDFLFVCRVCKGGGDRFVELVLVWQRVFIVYLMFCCCCCSCEAGHAFS